MSVTSTYRVLSKRRLVLASVSRIALATAAFATCSEAFAQDGGKPIALPVVSVTSADLVPIDSDKVGSSVTVLQGRELKEKNIQTLADALRGVPGVEVDQSGGRGAITAVRIRGGETRHTMVLIDGIEVNQLGFPGFDFADLGTDDIERVEVLRGPQSGLYGANAQAGVISITTISGRGQKIPKASVRVEGGSMSTGTAAVSASGSNGPFYGAITGSAYHTNGYNISRTGTEADGSKAMNGTVKLGADITPDWNVEGVVRSNNRSVATDPQSFVTGLAVDGDNRNDYRSTAARIGTTFNLLNGHLTQAFDAKLFDEHSRGFSSNVITSGADGQRVDFDSKSTVNFDSRIAGGEHHVFTLLLDRRTEHYQQITAPMTPYDKTRNSIAGEYILDLATATTLSGAVRQDYNTAFRNVFTYRGAVSQRFPMTGSRIHASIGKGVTDPDVFQLFGSSFNVANPNLTPESSVGWDAGFEQKLWNDRIVMDVTYFSTNFSDKIELVTVPGVGFMYRNGIGAAIRRGIEFSQTIEWFSWLSTRATYTYLHALDSTGLQEIRRPPHSGSFEIIATTPDKRTKGSIRIVANGVREDLFFGLAGGRVDLPAYTLVRATVSHDLTPFSTVYVRAENLFNQQYEEVYSFRAPSFALYAGLKVHTPD